MSGNKTLPEVLLDTSKNRESIVFYRLNILYSEKINTKSLQVSQ